MIRILVLVILVVGAPLWSLGMEVRIGPDRTARLEHMAVSCTLEGAVLTRRIELAVRQDGKHPEEGELICPLAEGEQVVGFAMDVHGRRREGVVVPRDRARHAYEEIVRRMVDPGILEVDEDRGEFRTRLYPLEPGKVKRAWITTLQVVDDGVVEAWPTSLARPSKWQLEIVASAGMDPPAADGWSFKEEDGRWMARGEGQDEVVRGCRIRWAADHRVTLRTRAEGRGEWACRVVSASPPASDLRGGKVVELWCDGSKAPQEQAVETARALLGSLKPARVRLRIFRESPGEPELFNVRKDGVEDVLARLQQVKGQGMARPGLLPWDQVRAQAVVLLTDGTFPEGPQEVGVPGCPLHVIDAGSESSAWLRPKAILSGGGWHAAGRLDPYAGCPKVKECAERLGASVQAAVFGDRLVLACHGSGGTPAGRSSIESETARTLWAIVHSAGLRASGGSRVELDAFNQQHGVVDASSAWLVLETAADYLKYGFEPPRSDEALVREWSALRKKQRASGDRWLDLLADRWKARCDRLEVAPGPMEERLLVRLAERVSYWTRQSQQHEELSMRDVRPLVKLLGEIEQLTAGPVDGPTGRRIMKALGQLDEFESELRVRVKWIEITVGGKVRRPGKRHLAKLTTLYEAVQEAGGATEFGALNRVKLYRNGRAYTYDLTREDHRDLELYPGDIVDVPQKNWLGNGGGAPGRKAPFAPDGDPPRITVTAAEWDPGRPYIKVLDEILAAGGDWRMVHAAQRRAYGWRADFHLDCIELFERRGRMEAAVTVAGELAELAPDNVEVLRRAARALRRLGEAEVSESLFRRVLVLAPEDGVSRHDLARSRAEAGRTREAAGLLWKAANEGEDRYRTGRSIVLLEELNALLAREKLDGRELGIDARFLRHVPVEMRIVLEWDAAQSNVDLLVRDPFGGLVGRGLDGRNLPGVHWSGNVTRGYGPESLCLAGPLAGFHELIARFYGDWKEPDRSAVTAEVEVTRFPGTPRETRERLAVRVEEQEEKPVGGVLVIPAGWE